MICTGVAKRVLPWLRECFRQVEAEVVSNSSNKIHQTWEALFWRPLYIAKGKYFLNVQREREIINAAEATAEEEFMSDHGMDKVGFLTLQQGCVDSSLDRMLKTKTQGSSLH